MSQVPPSSGKMVFPPYPVEDNTSIDFLMKKLETMTIQEKQLKEDLQDIQNEIYNTLMDLKPLAENLNEKIAKLTK